MIRMETQGLEQLCGTQGLLAAMLLRQPEPVVWLGGFNQSDYAHLLLISQNQSLPFLSPSLDAIQLSSQAVLVHSQLMSDGTLAMLVFAFEIRLKDLDARAASFLNAIETQVKQKQSQSLLDGLKARQVEPKGVGSDNLLALFTGMPEADPSNDATQPFRVSKLSVQTLEKSVSSWNQIF